MVKESKCRATAYALMDNGIRTRSMDMEYACGLMELVIKVNGETTKSMARV